MAQSNGTLIFTNKFVYWREASEGLVRKHISFDKNVCLGDKV